MGKQLPGTLILRSGSGIIPRKEWADGVGVFHLRFIVDGRQRQVSLHTGVLEEAERKKLAMMAPLAEAERKEQARELVKQLQPEALPAEVEMVDVWNVFAASHKRAAGTMAQYRSAWRSFAGWVDSRRPDVRRLADISMPVALDYAEWLAGRGVSPRTFNAGVKALGLICRKVARRRGVEWRDVWAGVDRQAGATVSRRELSADELRVVLGKLQDVEWTFPEREEWYVVFCLGAYTGQRLKDCVLMEWTSVKLKGEGWVDVVPAKTSASSVVRLRIPLHSVLAEALRGAERGESAFVAPALAGRYAACPQSVSASVGRIFAAAGFTTRKKGKDRQRRANVCGFHSLRHSFVSWLANAGVPQVVIQALVGHGNPAMTAHYAHMSDEAKRGILLLPGRSTAPLTEAERIEEAVAALELATAENWELAVSEALRVLQ